MPSRYSCTHFDAVWQNGLLSTAISKIGAFGSRMLFESRDAIAQGLQFFLLTPNQAQEFR